MYIYMYICYDVGCRDVEPRSRSMIRMEIYVMSSPCGMVICHVQRITCRCHLPPLLLFLCVCACLKGGG